MTRSAPTSACRGWCYFPKKRHPNIQDFLPSIRPFLRGPKIRPVFEFSSKSLMTPTIIADNSFPRRRDRPLGQVTSTKQPAEGTSVPRCAQQGTKISWSQMRRSFHKTLRRALPSNSAGRSFGNFCLLQFGLSFATIFPTASAVEDIYRLK